jgi:hypothetical protein
LLYIRLPGEDEVVFQKYYFEKENKEDMTGREKALAYGQSLRDNYVLFLKQKLREKDLPHEAAQHAQQAENLKKTFSIFIKS